MSLLFINENKATIGVEANRCFVKYSDGMKKMVPIETLEGCSVSQEDSIRVYKIIGKGQVVSFGKKAEKEDEDIIVI